MSTNMVQISRVLPVVVTLMALAVSLLGMPTTAQAAEKLADLMGDTELKYEALDEISYLVPFEMEGDKTLEVYVTYNNEEKNFVLVFATVLNYEDNHEFRPETMARAMQINNDYPVIKLCLDSKNGDLDCQVEAYVRTLDGQALEMYIHFIAAMTAQFEEELRQIEDGLAVG